MAEELLKNESQRSKGLAEISSGKETRLNRLKRNFYESMLQIFPLDSSSEKNLKNQKTRFLLLHVLKTVQILSMLEVNRDMHLWSSYSFLWRFFLFFRLDYFSDQLSIYAHILFVIEGLLLASAVLFTYVISRNYRENPPHMVIITLIRWTFTLMAEVLYLPAQVFLIRANFYWIIDSEYSQAEMNLPGTALALISLYAIRLIYIIATTDTKHRDKKINILSKAHSDFEIYEYKAQIASVLFYALRGEQLPTYSALLLGLNELYVAYMFMKELPYYNKFANMVKSVSHLAVSFFSCAMLVGRFMNNAGVTFVISVIGVPIMTIAVLMAYSFKIQGSYEEINNLIRFPEEIKSFYQLERTLRSFLCEDTDADKEVILDAFSAYFAASAFNREGMLAIWQSNYCMQSLKDFRLARIRLSMYLLSSTDFESDYQYFVCNKSLELDRYHDDVEFLKFKIYLERTIKLDKKFCLQYQNALKELNDSNPNVNKIEELLMKIDKNLKVLEKSYRHMMSINPENSEVFQLYSTFLSAILVDNNQSIIIEQMHNGAKMENKKGDVEFFNEDNGFIIVSGEPSSLGTISYINARAAKILKDTANGITGSSLSNYLPKTIAPLHNTYLKKFLMNCKSNKIDLFKSVFLCTGIGFLVEVYTEFRCIVDKHYPFFLVLVKERNKNREIMVLDNQNCIIAHSEGLPRTFKIDAVNMVGCCTDYLFPQISSLAPQEATQILKDVYLKYKPKRIKNTIIHLYLVYTDYYWPAHEKNNLNTNRMQKSSKNIQFKGMMLEDTNSKKKSFVKNSSIIENNKNEKKIRKIIHGSKNTLKVLRYSLLLLVGFMGITLTSCSLYVVYGYDSKTIYSLLNDLNKAKSSMLTIAELTRIERLSQDFPKYTSLVDKIDFLSEIQNLEKFRAIAEEAFDRYPNCESLKDVLHSDTSYWYQGEIKKDNIINIIGAFVSYSYSYFEGGKTQEVYEFLVKNGIGRPYKHIGTVDDTIHHCANEAIDFFNLIILVFFMIDSVIIGVFVVTNTLFLFKFRNLCQRHWERMVETLSVVHQDIQNTLIARLEETHEIENAASHFQQRSRAKLSVPKISAAKSMIKYAYILVLFVVYLTCVYLVFEKNLEESITKRRNFCFELENKGTDIQELGFWTLESLYEDTKHSLCNSLEDECPFKPPSVVISQIQTDIRKRFKMIQLHSNMQITDHEIHVLFKEFEVLGKKYYSGMNGLMSSMVIDSQYYSRTKSDSILFYELVQDFLYSQRQFFREAIDTTEEVITKDRNNMVLFNSTFTICNFIMITLFLLRYIQRQREYIKHRSNFYKLVSKELNANKAV